MSDNYLSIFVHACYVLGEVWWNDIQMIDCLFICKRQKSKTLNCNSLQVDHFQISSLLLQTTNKVALSVYTFNPVLGGGLCDFNPIVGTYFKCCVVLVSHNKIVIKIFLGEWQASRFWNYSSYCLSHLPSIHGTSN